MERQTLKWKDIRNEIFQINNDLAGAIDLIDPSFPLELGIFNYGEEITNKECPEPFLVLSKSCEMFFEYQSNPMTYALIQPGEIGLPEIILNQPAALWINAPWKITAGSRSVFMIPKVCDGFRHKKLEEAINIEVRKPTNPSMHWNVFKNIANSNKTDYQWKCRVLFLKRELWGIHQNDTSWQAFYRALSQKALDKVNFQGQQHYLDMLIGMAQRERNIRFSLPQTEDLKYLIMLGLNGIPGLQLAQDNMHIPVEEIQAAYQEYYGMEEYAPLIVSPGYFDWAKENASPIYYSFNTPTSYYLSPQVNNYKTNAKDLHLIVWAFKKLVDFILNKGFVSEDSKIYQLLKFSEYRFYHPMADNYKGFTPPSEIPIHSPEIMYGWENFRFPMHGAFWKGCVGIKKL